MYSTRVHARIPTYILARKSARRTKVCGQLGELNGPRALRQADFRERRGTPRRLLREDPRAARKSVSVPWNLSFKINANNRDVLCLVLWPTTSAL